MVQGGNHAQAGGILLVFLGKTPISDNLQFLICLPCKVTQSVATGCHLASWPDKDNLLQSSSNSPLHCNLPSWTEAQTSTLSQCLQHGAWHALFWHLNMLDSSCLAKIKSRPKVALGSLSDFSQEPGGLLLLACIDIHICRQGTQVKGCCSTKV